MIHASVAAEHTAGNRKSGYLLIKIVDEYLIWILLAMSIMMMTAISNHFFSKYNLINLALSSSILGIMVIAESLCVLIGKLDLSVESTLAFAALIGAILIKQNVDPWLAMLVVLAIGAGIGLINGLFIVKIGVDPFVQTLAMNIIFRGLIFLISGGIPLMGFPEGYRIFGSTQVMGIPTPVLILVLLYVFFIILLERMKWGRKLYAVGQNGHAAFISGVNVQRVNIQAFVLAGLLAAFAGLILSTRLNSIDYNVGNGMNFEIMAAAVIGGISLTGGRGRMLGAIGGVLFLTSISSILTWLNLSIYWVETTRGIVIAAAVFIDAMKNKLREKVLRG